MGAMKYVVSQGLVIVWCKRIVQVGTRSIPPQNIIIAYRDTGSSDGQVKSIGQVDDSFNNLKMLGSGNTPTF